MGIESTNNPGGEYLALNSQSLMLLYLADELPAEQRKQFENRLANEPVLRTELEGIRRLMEASDGAISSADAAGRDSVEKYTAAEAAAMRQAVRAVRQWTVHRKATSPVVVSSKRYLHWRSLCAAAAILLVIGYTAWWGMTPVTPMSQTHPRVLGPQEETDLLAASFDQSSLADPFDAKVAAAFSNSDELDENFDGQLLAARPGSNLR